MDLFLHSLIARFESFTPQTKDILLANLPSFRKAFTVGDYEVLEQIGDAVISQFIVTYSYRLFPFLDSKDGVKIVARIRIKYTSRSFLASLAESLEFWPHIILADAEPLSATRRQALLEDVFEAFIGAVNVIVDQHLGVGTGYIVCYALLTEIFSSVNIDISYNSLFDAKTRLKEVCDFFKHRLTLIWTSSTGANEIKAILTYILDGKKMTYCAAAHTKGDAEQIVAAEVLKLLSERGIKKDEPEIFARARN